MPGRYGPRRAALVAKWKARHQQVPSRVSVDSRDNGGPPPLGKAPSPRTAQDYFNSAEDARQQVDGPRALPLWVVAALAGHALAQVRVGDCYYHGLAGVAEPNYDTCSYWYGLALRQESADAWDRLGNQYMEGRGKARFLLLLRLFAR
jgi:TPR repeat protein